MSVGDARLKARRGNLLAGVMLASFSLTLAGCNQVAQVPTPKAEINNKTKFSSAEYGVKGSPRVTEARNVPKGGGRYQVGKPYKIKGKWYKPAEDPQYAATGMASWYGPNFHGRLTANGEVYNQYALSAAHPTMPLPSYARVTNLENGSSVIVRVNDRGPYAHGRIIDLSAKAAKLLAYEKKGVANVKVEYVGKARLDGEDDKFLLASYRGPGIPEIAPGATQPGTMIAMADEPQPAAPIASAIASNTGQAEGLDQQTILLAQIPVPTERPSTYDGIPFEVMPLEPMLTASLQPIGYAEDNPLNRRVARAFATVDNGKRGALDDKPVPDQQGDASQMVEIMLGSFSDPALAELAAQSNADLGLVKVTRSHLGHRSAYQASIMVAGDVVTSVLSIAKRRGLQAEIAK
ncbi:MAG: septal ring lytic transglycosylase RlpA family protein [Nitratireductor sp.]